MNSSKCSDFLDILKDSIKILSSNGRLIAFTAVPYLVLYSISFLLNILSGRHFIYDLNLKVIALASARPGTPKYASLWAGIRQDIGFFLGVQTAYLLPYLFISIFAKTAIIFISSCFYSGNNFSLKELVFRISRSWTRPFVTAFYVELLGLGYMCFTVLPLLIPSLVFFDHPVVLMAILVSLVIVFITFYLYLGTVWQLAMVVSVVEDSYGISALGKARELVKGERVHGFVLNLLTGFVLLLIAIIVSILQPARPITLGLIQVCFSCLVDMFCTSAYSTLYFHCKMKLEKSGSIGYYSAILTAPIVGENVQQCIM